MRQIIAPPPKDDTTITKLPTGGYHVAARDGADFTLEGIAMWLDFDAPMSWVTVLMDPGDADMYEVYGRSVDEEPETTVFEVFIPRARMDMALAYRKAHPVEA